MFAQMEQMELCFKHVVTGTFRQHSGKDRDLEAGEFFIHSEQADLNWRDLYLSQRATGIRGQ